MRLLHISGDAWGDDPLDITLCEFLGSDVPPYMILSHRWREEEVLFADMIGPDRTSARKKKGYTKLETSCKIAFQQGLQYAWIDTCCIDKSSSAELSEAINSMYSYYAQADVCYAFLDDVNLNRLQDENSLDDCAWFSRGWTLQELIAPHEMYFYSAQWRAMGSKSSMCRHISLASGIDEKVLKDPGLLNQVCVSEKMSWAAKRSTTRPEDEAYSLMGLFGVNLPPLYGEGRRKAFRRLQLEIMNTTTDHTLFAWHSDITTGDMLAPTVKHFKYGAYVQSVAYRALSSQDQIKPDFSMTNFGLHIQLPLWKVPGHDKNLYFALFACKMRGDPWYVGTYLRETRFGRVRRFHRDAFNGSTVCLFPAPDCIFLPQTSLESLWISESNPALKILSSPAPSFWAHDRILIQFATDLPKRFSQTYWNSDNLVPTSVKPRYLFDRFTLLAKHGIRHEVIALGGEEPINFAFGVLEGQIWVHIGLGNETATGDQAYHDLFSAYHFPTGMFWHHQPKLGSPLFLASGSVRHTFYTDETAAVYVVGVRFITEVEKKGLPFQESSTAVLIEVNKKMKEDGF